MRGTISARRTKDGQIKYRAQVRIDREGLGKFTESRTFSKKSLAAEWLRQRTAEIERDPSILLQVQKKQSMTLGDAIDVYVEEIEDTFARTKILSTKHLKNWPISKIALDELTRKDYVEHVTLRRNGNPDLCAKAVASSTAGQDLYYIRSLLIHAESTWGEAVKVEELDAARRGLH